MTGKGDGQVRVSERYSVMAGAEADPTAIMRLEVGGCWPSPLTVHRGWGNPLDGADSTDFQ